MNLWNQLIINNLVTNHNENIIHIFIYPFHFYQQMKTSRGNSFRLQRLAKTNSLRKETTEYNPNETFKLSAIHSVSRGVKYSELQPLTGYDLRKLRKEPAEEGDAFFLAAHQNFTMIRKRYDDMRKQRVEKEELITKLKEDMRKYEIFQSQYSGKIEGGKVKVQQLEKALKQKKHLLEVTTVDKKVLQHIDSRHKSDKVFYDQRKFDLDQELKFLKKQLAIFHREGLEMGESSERTTKIYEKLIEQLNQQNNERQMHIANLEIMINDKKDCLDTNAIRAEQIREIAERAMQDKDENQKQWRRIYLSQLFVAKMLRTKIENQMEKFSVVELAFKQIKTSTGVSDGKTLVFKYLNKQLAYGQLLGKIAENQKKIQILKSETQSLVKQSKELDLDKQTIDNIKLKTVEIHKELKQLEFYDEKKKIADEKRSKVRSWVGKQIKKFKNILKLEINSNVQNTNESIVDAMKRYFNCLLQELEKADNDVIKMDKKLQNLSQKDMERIMRVKPKKARKNSVGEQIFDLQEEETTAAVSYEEAELIETQRQVLIKHNQKFMKEAKKRKQEQRRILAQKLYSQKEKVKVPEVKKEQEES